MQSTSIIVCIQIRHGCYTFEEMNCRHFFFYLLHHPQVRPMSRPIDLMHSLGPHSCENEEWRRESICQYSRPKASLLIPIDRFESLRDIIFAPLCGQKSLGALHWKALKWDGLDSTKKVIDSLSFTKTWCRCVCSSYQRFWKHMSSRKLFLLPLYGAYKVGVCGAPSRESLGKLNRRDEARSSSTTQM